MTTSRPAATGAAAGLDWRQGNLRQVVAGLTRFGDLPAILTLGEAEARHVTFRQLSERVGYLSRGLARRGLGDNGRVAILAANAPEWIAAALAVIDAGGVAVPLDARLDEESLRHILADCAARLAIVGEQEQGRIARLCPEGIELVPLEGLWEALDAEAEPAAAAPTRPEPDGGDPAVIFYTSGTTGLPKGVPLTHRNLLFELDSLLSVGLMSEGERLLLPLPLHHVYPFVVGMLAPLVYGVGIVLPQSMTGPHILEATRSFNVSTVIGVPRLYEALVSAVESRVAARGAAARLLYRTAVQVSLLGRRYLSLHPGKLLLRPLHRQFGTRLRLMASGGAALDADLAWRMEALGWTVSTGYGLTETSPLAALVRPGDSHFESVGKPLPSVELRIAPLTRESDNEVSAQEVPPAQRPEDGEIGEIQLRGPNVFAGYLGLPDKTAEAFTGDGWFRTEDRGYVDREGYLHVLGRSSTFVVTAAGKNISLEELERRYERCGAIKEIGIFMHDGRLAGLVVPDPAVLRDAGGGAPDEAVREAVRAVARQLPRYERIDDLAVVRDALARTRLGKIRRDKLRRHFDAVRTEGEAESSGPMPVDEMSGEDQALLEQAPARATWDFLCTRYPAMRLTPDSDVARDLGIDSLSWIDLTLEIRERCGVALSEAATARIESLRDLLQEAVDAAGRGDAQAAALEDDPESYLTERQKRWLKPLSAFESALAWPIYHLNRALVRAFFRVRVSGLENLREAGQMILTPNHASVLDPFVIAAVVPYDILRRSAFAGWTGMAFANPLYRFVVRLGRTLPVEHDRAAFSSLAAALVALRDGMSLIWFPEGQRSGDGRLQRFMPGIGALLSRAPATVVPAFIAGTFEAMPQGQRLPRPGRIEVVFAPPCRSEALDQSGEGDRAETRIAETLHRRLEELQAGAEHLDRLLYR